MDLQWKMRPKYNVRLCAGLRKSVGARTMENNGKNNAQNNGNSRIRRVLTARLPIMSATSAMKTPAAMGAGRKIPLLELQP
jgi:hypothetical protein